MYGAVPDPYCYQASDVLRNRAGLRDQAALDEFETALTFQRAAEPLPNGRLSATHYRNIHHHLFQDVYTWAGKYRTVRISKSGSTFCYPENIPSEMRNLFSRLKKDNALKNLDLNAFSQGLAVFLSDLNAIHPFRDGNGRSQLPFAQLIATRAGHPLALDQLDKDEFLTAMIRSFSGHNGLLISQIKNLAS